MDHRGTDPDVKWTYGPLRVPSERKISTDAHYASLSKKDLKR